MRLIDANDLKYEMFADSYKSKWTNDELVDAIDHQPTVEFNEMILSLRVLLEDALFAINNSYDDFDSELIDRMRNVLK